ncbi:MAG: PEP-CTERM sorting domain-containing protein [Burkholderiaceae bacterium]
MQMKAIARSLALAAIASGASLAHAGTVDWADWTSTTQSTVDGAVLVGATSVGVSYSGAQYSFAQINNGGFNYWQSPSTPYVSATVSNAPSTSDMVGLNAGGTSVITFSQAVVNPLIAFVSWNGANVTFGGGADTQTYDIQYLSSGCGYWGCGTYGSPTSDSFTGSGELHGVIELLGTYSMISFTDTTPEYWHGLTVGIEGGIASTVPEPGNMPLMVAGLGIVGLLLRRRPS